MPIPLGALSDILDPVFGEVADALATAAARSRRRARNRDGEEGGATG